jgi:predicted Holliday junction resolvase-like endonuclease
MSEDKPEVRKLKDQQLAQERAARDALDQAETEADVHKQLRRADKAHYLREKLQEREQADRRTAGED